METQLLDRIRVVDFREDTASFRTLTEFNIYVSASLVDPFKSGKVINIDQLACTVNISEKISKFLDRFKAAYNLTQFNLKIIYNHRLYDEHLTFGAIRIKNNSHIEIVSLSSEKIATENYGFIFTFWSLVPFMLSLSFLIGGLAGRFDIIIRGIYVVVGTFILIPSFTFFILGLLQKCTENSQVAIVNHYWFDRCCDCCCKCGPKKQDLDDSDDYEILQPTRNLEEL